MGRRTRGICSVRRLRTDSDIGVMNYKCLIFCEAGGLASLLTFRPNVGIAASS
jgi:hypothetical protein